MGTFARALIGIAMVTIAVAIADVGVAAYQKRFNPADQAAARAVVLHRADLPAGVAWKGGFAKPDFTALKCPGYAPKDSDLVVTGAARTTFEAGTSFYDGQAQIMQTARMVRLDWQRSIQTPGLLPCLRSSFAKEMGSDAKLVSLRKLAFPRVATYTMAFRVVFDTSAQAGTVRLVSDAIFFGGRRTELTLTTVGLYAERVRMQAIEQSVARKLANRIRA